jgi:hypothetical protein
MAVTPIAARCRRCSEDFYLFELGDHRSGTCPRCGWILTLDWTAVLLEEASRADLAQRHLVGALRNLRSLPGNLVLRPQTVLRNLFEEVGWEQDLAEDPELLREELHALGRLLDGWMLHDPIVVAAQPRQSWLRRAWHWITGRPPGRVTLKTPVTPVARADVDRDTDSPAATTTSRPRDVLVGS